LTFWLLAAALLVLAVALLAAWRYLAAVARLRGRIGRLARDPVNEAVPRPPPKRFGGLRAAAHDLESLATRVKSLEAVASEGKLGLTAILDSIPEGVFIVDSNLRLRLANPALSAMFRLPSSPVGRPVVEAFGNADLHRLVQEGVHGGKPHRGEIVIEHEASPRVFELSISPLDLEPGRRGAVVVVHNITRIRNLEQVRREFVANVSHELRTPLTIINGYLETLLDGGLDDRGMTEGALQVMSKHADRLCSLVDDLLVISRAESRQATLQTEWLDLRELLRRIIEQLDKPIQAQGAEVRVTAAGGDFQLEADSTRLEQVFLNLLENALRHGNRPDLSVEFYLERIGPNIHLQITDNGPGIPYEDQEHIFERFYRVHKHRSRDTGGTGLGLSIVKNVVLAHSGKVSVSSIPGNGSTFHVVLPVRQPSPVAPPPRSFVRKNRNPPSPAGV
jgi:two-component system phosphate regulon sensor histidine kinase PhoR